MSFAATAARSESALTPSQASQDVDACLELRASGVDRPLFHDEATPDERVAALQAYYGMILDGRPMFDDEDDVDAQPASRDSDLAMVGKPYGRWTVTGLSDLNGRVMTRCECGEVRCTIAANLRKGTSTGCGCSATSRLSDADRDEIMSSPLTGVELAAKFGISKQTVSKIRRTSVVGRANADHNRMKCIRGIIARNRAERARAWIPDEQFYARDGGDGAFASGSAELVGAN